MAQKPRTDEPQAENEKVPEAQPSQLCGIVRPIANVDGYPEGHWLEVHQILADAAEEAGYQARLVSDDEAIGVILGRIVNNLHDDPITIVDVSGLNPNVMFELGMRLAFDKPVVVIKDNVTRYPFDASPIEYLPYPSDLRHAPLMAFKEKLTVAIKSTVRAPDVRGYRSFLSHFGSYKPGELGEGAALSAALIMDELQTLKALVRRQSDSSPLPRRTPATYKTSPIEPTSNTPYAIYAGMLVGEQDNIVRAINEMRRLFGSDYITFAPNNKINNFSLIYPATTSESDIFNRVVMISRNHDVSIEDWQCVHR